MGFNEIQGERFKGFETKLLIWINSIGDIGSGI